MNFDFEDFYVPDYYDYMDETIMRRWRGGIYVDDFIDSFSAEELDGISQYLAAVQSPIDLSEGNRSWLIVDYLRDWIVSLMKDDAADIEKHAYILNCVSNALIEREQTA